MFKNTGKNKLIMPSGVTLAAGQSAKLSEADSYNKVVKVLIAKGVLAEQKDAPEPKPAAKEKGKGKA